MNERHLEKIKTGWNVVQRRVWRLPPTAHSKFLPILANQTNLLGQIYKRARNFVDRLINNNNEKVKFIANNALLNPDSCIATNKLFLESRETDTPTSLESLCTTTQIIELNQCIDGEANCGLNKDQITEILIYVSTS